MPMKFLVSGGNWFCFWGGGSANFTFMGAGIFLKSSLLTENCYLIIFWIASGQASQNYLPRTFRQAGYYL